MLLFRLKQTLNVYTFEFTPVMSHNCLFLRTTLVALLQCLKNISTKFSPLFLSLSTNELLPRASLSPAFRCAGNAALIGGELRIISAALRLLRNVGAHTWKLKWQRCFNATCIHFKRRIKKNCCEDVDCQQRGWSGVGGEGVLEESNTDTLSTQLWLLSFYLNGVKHLHRREASQQHVRVLSLIFFNLFFVKFHI